MNWFLGFLLVVSLGINVLLSLILLDIREEQKLRQSEDNDELDRELLRIVNGR